MRQFNRLITFPFEVLAQLLWCYLLLSVFFLLFFGMAISLLGGNLSGFLVLPMVGASTPSAPALVLQFATMSAFRIGFWPRFPDVPGLLTFALAMLIASTISTVAFGVERLPVSAGTPITEWAASHAEGIAGWFWFTVIASLVGAIVNHVLFVTGVKKGHLKGPGKWFGYLFVGQQAYEDFIERENNRLYGKPFQAELSSGGPSE